MADDNTPKSGLIPWQFDFVSSSYQPFAPLRSMQNSGFRQTSWGGMTWDGIFRPRFPMVSTGVGPTVDSNGSFTDGYNGQTPGVISYYPIRDFSSTIEGYVMVILTTAECWIDVLASAPINVTPIYTIGTVSITTATKALVGTGTAWNTEGIKSGQLVIFPDASVRSIDTVNSDTSITLKDNYTGTTLTNAAYTIRRTGRFGSTGSGGVAQAVPKNLFARIFNGDLYYTYVEGAANFCVVKVENVTTGSPGTPTIIGAALFDNLSGCDIWTDAIYEIKGLELLTDGRVVLATTEKPASTTTQFQSRIRYSSHLDVMVWNSPPAGTNEVVNLPGKMNGMLAYGPYLACHFDTGIVMGVPTGQDDPPLNYQAVQGVATGCVNAKAMVNTSIGQAFLGSDNNAYVFDGSGVRQLSDATRTGSSAGNEAASWHAAVDESHHLIWLFDMQSLSATTSTTAYAIDFHSGIPTYHKLPTMVSCAGSNLGILTSQLLLGIPSYDPTASGTGGATSTMVYQLSSLSSADVVPAFTGYTAAAAMSLLTDWIDFGMIGVDKTFAFALLYYISSGAYTIRLTAKRDGLSTETISLTTANTSTEEKFAKLFFTPKTSEKWQFTLDTTTLSTSAWDVRPQRMVLFFRPVAESIATPR